MSGTDRGRDDSSTTVVVEGGLGRSPEGGFYTDGDGVPDDLKNFQVIFRTDPDSPEAETGPCPDCKAHDGEHMTMEEAENLIPVHPNCVCHYEFSPEDVPRWRSVGRTLVVTEGVRERFWEKVDAGASDGCWGWTGATNEHYGQIRVDGRLEFAHRLSYAIEHGAIDGPMVLHACDNKLCVRPGHLYAGDNADNIRDALERGQRSESGEDNGYSKLTEDEVLEIRRRYDDGETQTSLAEEFGVSASWVSRVVNREVWDHLDSDRRYVRNVHSAPEGTVVRADKMGLYTGQAAPRRTETGDDMHTKSLEVKATAVVEREVGGEEREVLKVPISSTAEDRDEDEFAPVALEGMAEQVRTEQPLVHLNHGFTDFAAPMYDARETIGTQFDAEVDEDDDILYAFVNPDHTHPEGTRMLEQVRDEKQAIKFSVGFNVHDSEEKADGSGRRFLDVDLAETSKVSIPSNPEASVQIAAKAAEATQRIGASGMEIGDEAAFASALAAELISGRDPDVGELVEKTAGGDGGATDAEPNMEGKQEEAFEEVLERLDEQDDALEDIREDVSEVHDQVVDGSAEGGGGDEGSEDDDEGEEEQVAAEQESGDKRYTEEDLEEAESRVEDIRESLGGETAPPQTKTGQSEAPDADGSDEGEEKGSDAGAKGKTAMELTE